MTDVPPDRLSVDPSSPFYDEAALARGRPDPLLAHTIFLDVTPLDATKTHADASRKRRFVVERTRGVDAEPVGWNVGHRGKQRLLRMRGRRGVQTASALTRLVRREILRDAAFLWTMPFCAARASLGSASLSASAATFGSLEAIASSTLRT